MTHDAKKTRYREGDWFALPVADGRYAVGLIARAPRRGGTLFGYFFGPLGDAVPSLEQVRAYRSDEAVYVGRFRHDALVSGRWTILGSSDAWNRAAWPMPDFYIPRSQQFTGESYAVRYSEDDPDGFVAQWQIPVEEESQYPPDEGVFPPNHLEYRLGKVVGAANHDRGVEEAVGGEDEGVRYFVLVPPEAVQEVRVRLFRLGFSDVEVNEERNDLVDVVALQRGEVGALRGSVDEVEAELTALARSVGGEYDGLEWSLGAA